jgi:hypothetical protein
MKRLDWNKKRIMSYPTHPGVVHEELYMRPLQIILERDVLEDGSIGETVVRNFERRGRSRHERFEVRYKLVGSRLVQFPYPYGGKTYPNKLVHRLGLYFKLVFSIPEYSQKYRFLDGAFYQSPAPLTHASRIPLRW